jgi:hypothetical protein
VNLNPVEEAAVTSAGDATEADAAVVTEVDTAARAGASLAVAVAETGAAATIGVGAAGTGAAGDVIGSVGADVEVVSGRLSLLGAEGGGSIPSSRLDFRIARQGLQYLRPSTCLLHPGEAHS